MNISDNEFKTMLKKYNDELMKYKRKSKNTDEPVVQAQTEPEQPVTPDTNQQETNDEAAGQETPDTETTEPQQRSPSPIPEGSTPQMDILMPTLPVPSIPEDSLTRERPEETDRIVLDKNVSPNPVDIGTSFVAPENENQIVIPGAAVNLDGTGYLVVQVFTARGAAPTIDADIIITSTDEQGERLVYKLTSDISGKTEVIPLDTALSELSQTPGDINPYAAYNIKVVKPGYFTVNNLNVPIFDKETAVQPVEMIPFPENYNGDSVINFESSGAIL